jgi:hypothetical protein
MAPRKKGKQTINGDAAAVPAAAAVEQHPVRSTLLPLPLDQLREQLWEPMSGKDKRTLRELSKGMRSEGNECVRTLSIDVTNSRQPSSALAAFPLLEELTLRSSPSATVSGQQVAACFSLGSLASMRVSKLSIEGVKTLLWTALDAFPSVLQASLVTLTLRRCCVTAFLALGGCSALRSLHLVYVEFESCEAAASLQRLTQVCWPLCRAPIPPAF